MEPISAEEFEQDEVLQDSMMFRLIQLSESAKRLSDSYKESHASIPWTSIYGLRNRIVQDYGSVDFSVVYDTLKNDIPVLQMAINRVNDTK